MKTAKTMQRLQALWRLRANPAWLAAIVALLLPTVLVTYSLITAHELEQMRGVYLRNRVADIAARLETIDTLESDSSLLDTLAAEEPHLSDIRVYDSSNPEPALQAVWSGRELYRTEETVTNGRRIFRAWVPFHSGNRLHVARIDLGADAADFLVRHAYHNVIAAFASGLALLLLSAYGIWSARRQAKLGQLAQLGRLSAGLAHEIRNPLGTMKGFTQLACEQADSGTAGLLEPVLNEIQRLERLVNDLLLFGRPNSPKLRDFAWRELARETAAHAVEAIGNKSVRFVDDSGDFRMRSDPDMLKQVLLNLVRNAAQALDDTPDGEICLRAARTSKKVVIAVEDNGPGLPESVRARMFEPFHTTKANGTGLGLSISKKLVEALGGRLRLEPLEPRGTRAQVVIHGNHTGH